MSSTLHNTAQLTPSAIRTIVEDTVRMLFRELHHAEAPAELDPQNRLDADLGFDSLARLELVGRLERALGLDIPQAALESLGTVGDLLAMTGSPEAADTAGTIAPANPISARPLASRPGVGQPSSAATLVETLIWRAERQPFAEHAIVLGDGEPQGVSYAVLLERARSIASGLAELEVAQGATIALMLPTSIEYLEAFYGVLLAGAIAVPIYPPAHRAGLEDHLARYGEILANAGAEILIVSPGLHAVAAAFYTRTRRLRRALTVDELIERGGDRQLPAAPPADAIALLQYTSGSTGSPKGVILTHGQLLANIRAMGEAVGVSETDVLVSWLPLYHDMGLIGAWLGSLYFGCFCVLMPPTAFLARPVRWLQAIHRYRATLSACPNFGYEVAARRVTDDDLKGLDLSSLRVTFNGAEPVVRETLERFSKRFAPYGLRPEAMTPVYGLAEAGAGLTFPPLGRGPVIDFIDRAVLERTGEARPASASATTAAFVSCGRPLPGYRLRILDDHGEQAPERIEGDLQFTGPSATSGYFRNDLATASLRSGVWRNTGDRAYLAAGELYITGRTKDIIIRRGRHLYPDQVERAVDELEGIRKGCVAAFGAHDAQSGTERLIVVAETRETDPSERRQLRDRIAARVIGVIGEPADEVLLAPPRTIAKTSSGKLRRTATRQAYLQGLLMRANRPSRSIMIALAFDRVRLAVNDTAGALRWLAYGVYAWTVLVTRAAPTAVLATLLHDRGAIWRLYHRAAQSVVHLLKLPVRITYDSALDSHGPYVLVANHASYADSLVLVALLESPHRFVAKAELARAPVLSRVLGHLGTLFIERESLTQSAAEVARIRDALRRGERIVMFPEGTFRRESGLRAFHLGAFEAAAAARVPVIPLALSGTRAVLRDGWRLPRRSAVRAVIGAPLSVREGEDLFAAAIRLRDEARSHILRYCGEPDLTARALGL